VQYASNHWVPVTQLLPANLHVQVNNLIFNGPLNTKPVFINEYKES